VSATTISGPAKETAINNATIARSATRRLWPGNLRATPPNAAARAIRSDRDILSLARLLGSRIFEATGADISDLGEEHGHRVLAVR